jgi:hypothetical protein
MKSKTTGLNIGIVILATNAYFALGIRLIKRFARFYNGSNAITFYFFADQDPMDYVPARLDVIYIESHSRNWLDGTNSKFKNILSIGDRLKSDYIFYLDADTGIIDDFDEHWFIGDLVGAQHFNDQNLMAEIKNFDRNPLSMAYVPLDTMLPQTYFHGAFFGGKSALVMDFCRALRSYQLVDAKIPYEPCVNDESYINKYFHFQPPARIINCEDFEFQPSCKGGLKIGRRNIDLALVKEQLKILKEDDINFEDGAVILD